MSSRQADDDERQVSQSAEGPQRLDSEPGGSNRAAAEGSNRAALEGSNRAAAEGSTLATTGRYELPEWVGAPLLPSFYSADAETVARALLGTVLVRHGDPLRSGIIVETEAYLGEHDGASHARFGRTGRTEVMYGPPGRSYIYLIYGMYEMLNVVCAPEGEPQAVLIRGLRPLVGIGGRVDGPGKLTRELEIDRSINGVPFWQPPLMIHAGRPCKRVEVTPRIGIDYAGEWREAPLRYVATL